MKTNIYIDFQIWCISAPLREKINLNVLFHNAGVKTFFQREKNKFDVGISWFLMPGRLHLPFYFKTDLHLANCSRANVTQDFCVSAQSIIAWDQVELSSSLSGKKPWKWLASGLGLGLGSTGGFPIFFNYQINYLN